jgi:hypothetical protein
MTRRANSLVISSSLPNELGENQLAPSGPNAIPTAVAITSKVQINQMFSVMSAQIVGKLISYRLPTDRVAVSQILIQGRI